VRAFIDRICSAADMFNVSVDIFGKSQKATAD